MKLIEANKNKTVIEFDRDDFHILCQTFVSVREEYKELDPVILNVTEDEITKFGKQLDSILGYIVRTEKHLKE